MVEVTLTERTNRSSWFSIQATQQCLRAYSITMVVPLASNPNLISLYSSVCDLNLTYGQPCQTLVTLSCYKVP